MKKILLSIVAMLGVVTMSMAQSTTALTYKEVGGVMAYGLTGEHTISATAEWGSYQLTDYTATNLDGTYTSFKLQYTSTVNNGAGFAYSLSNNASNIATYNSSAGVWEAEISSLSETDLPINIFFGASAWAATLFPGEDVITIKKCVLIDSEGNEVDSSYGPGSWWGCGVLQEALATPVNCLLNGSDGGFAIATPEGNFFTWDASEDTEGNITVKLEDIVETLDINASNSNTSIISKIYAEFYGADGNPLENEDGDVICVDFEATSITEGKVTLDIKVSETPLGKDVVVGQIQIKTELNKYTTTDEDGESVSKDAGTVTFKIASIETTTSVTERILAIQEVKSSVDAVEVARYNLAGQKISGEQKGINIIVYSDGSSKKVLVK